jgi:CheY-like chemotaxis protein
MMFPREDPVPAEVVPDSMSGGLLERVRTVAQGISERVHTVLSRSTPTQGAETDRASDRALRVLVVDDNADAADALAGLVELLGCEVRACYGGSEARDALQAELPDVLLLDLSMPRVSGLEVAAHARALTRGRPLLLVATTALGSLEDRTATALAGFHFHFIKPIDTTTLRGALERFRALRLATAAGGSAAPGASD